MGHCIVMGESLFVAVVPQEAPRIGTYSHFKNVLSDKATSMPHMLKSHVKDAEAADKAEGSCYMPRVMSQHSQKYKSGHGAEIIKVAPLLHFLCFYGRTQKKQSTEETVKYAMAQLMSWLFNILSQRVTEDLCLGEDSG